LSVGDENVTATQGGTITISPTVSLQIRQYPHTGFGVTPGSTAMDIIGIRITTNRPVRLGAKAWDYGALRIKVNGIIVESTTVTLGNYASGIHDIDLILEIRAPNPYPGGVKGICIFITVWEA